jgi:hypothetical protein
MRLTLLASVLLFQACQLFGQQAAVAPNARRADRPAANSLPYRFSLAPGLIPQAAEQPASGQFPYRILLAPGLLPQAPEMPAAPARQGGGWFFQNWKQLLTPEPVMIAGHRMQLEAGRCVVPLLRVPLPAHYDDGMVRRMDEKSVDQAMVWTPPPDCPLNGK